MRITAEEFAARRDGACRSASPGRGLSAACSSTRITSSYYTGFAFIPTERPIAFVLAADGRGGMLVPRLEVEHAQANSAVRRSRTTTSTRASGIRWRLLMELLGALGVRGGLGADHDGYPWMFGYRGPSLERARRGAGAGRGSRRGPDGDQERRRDRAAARELRWANLAHTLLQRYTRPGVTETEVERRASTEATTRCSPRSAPIYRGAEPVVRRRGRRLPRPDRPQRRDPARARRTTSSSRPATSS